MREIPFLCSLSYAETTSGMLVGTFTVYDMICVIYLLAGK
jgi:hypothetical protein